MNYRFRLPDSHHRNPIRTTFAAPAAMHNPRCTIARSRNCQHHLGARSIRPWRAESHGNGRSEVQEPQCRRCARRPRALLSRRPNRSCRRRCRSARHGPNRTAAARDRKTARAPPAVLRQNQIDLYQDSRQGIRKHDQNPLDTAYCTAAGEGGCAAGAGTEIGRPPGAKGSGSPKFPPGRPPKPKNRRGGLQKLSPRSARFAINSSVMVTSTAGCLALAQNFFTACRV